MTAEEIKLETPRTYLREFKLSDMDDLYRLYEPPEITRFVEPLYERDEEIEYQQNYIQNIYRVFGFGLWMVIEKESGRLIGRCGVEYRENFSWDEAELAYLIAKDKWKMGFATEVCSVVVDYARDQLYLKSLKARINLKNTASLALAAKLGFEQTPEEVNGETVFRLIL